MKKVLVLMLALLTMVAVMSTAVMAAPLQGTDDLEGFDKQWKRGNDNVAPDVIAEENKKYFYDDFSGIMRGSFQAQPDWVGYEIAAGSTVTVTTCFWPNEPIKGPDDHFAFFTSADGNTWTELSATNTIGQNTLEKGGDMNDLNQRKWDLVTYTTAAIPEGHQYLKIQWPGDGDNVSLTQPWAQRLHAVTVNAPGAEKTATDEAPAAETPAAADTAENPKTSDPGVAYAFMMLAVSASGIAASKVFKKK